MSESQVDSIVETTQEIIQIVRDDETIKHCRINIINGVKNVFTKYKVSLAQIEKGEDISVRFYNDHHILHNDLFPNPDFMSKDWFNLFVFNIGKNGKTLGQEIRGVDMIAMELRSRFDSKYFSTLIVSEMNKRELSEAFEAETGQECPVTNYRYLGYDFDGIDILTYLKNILHTHSTQFLYRWATALDKLEKLQDKPLKLTQS